MLRRLNWNLSQNYLKIIMLFEINWNDVYAGEELSFITPLTA